MYSIGEISQMFDIPVSTLRYYDAEGLFPLLKREKGIRQFTDLEIEQLHLIQCLKASGLEIKDIRQFMEWTKLGPSSYQDRLELLEMQKKKTEEEIEKMNETLDVLKYKCWYYEKAMEEGNEDFIETIKLKDIPKDIQNAYLKIKNK